MTGQHWTRQKIERSRAVPRRPPWSVDTSSTMIRLLASKRPCPAPFNDERTAEESSVIGRVITNFFPPPPHHPEIPRVAPLVARITLADPLSEHASNPTTQ